MTDESKKQCLVITAYKNVDMLSCLLKTVHDRLKQLLTDLIMMIEYTVIIDLFQVKKKVYIGDIVYIGRTRSFR